MTSFVLIAIGLILPIRLARRVEEAIENSVEDQGREDAGEEVGHRDHDCSVEHEGGVEAAVARALPPGSVTPRLPFDRQQYAQELAKQLLPSVGGVEARALLGGAETAAPALPPGGSPEPALPPVGRPEPALPPGGKPAPALPYVRDRSSVINAVVQKIRGRRVGAPKATPAIEFPERQLTLPGLGGARRMPPEKQLTLPGLGDLTGAATGRQLALPGLGAPAERQLTLPGLGDLTGAAPERPAPRAAPREPLIRVPEEVRRVLAGGTPKPAVPSFEALVKAVADDVRAKAKRPSPLEMARPAAPGIGRRLDITDVKKIVRESAIEARRKLLSGELAGGGADIRKMLEAARKRQARAARSAAKRSPVVSARQRLGRAFGRMKGAR